MHPPHFTPQQRLSDWPQCIVELRCCTGIHPIPVRMLLAKHGDLTFAELISKLRCSKCRKPAAPIYLNASNHRTHCGGPPPDWSIELRPEPEPEFQLQPQKAMAKKEKIVLKLAT